MLRARLAIAGLLVHLSVLRGLHTEAFGQSCPANSSETNCTNGVDDDGDGLRDCQDDDCAAAASCNCGDGVCTPKTEQRCNCPQDCALSARADGFLDNEVAAVLDCDGDNIREVLEGGVRVDPKGDKKDDRDTKPRGKGKE